MTDTEDFLKIMSQGEDLATRLRAWAEIISIPSGPFVNEDLKFAGAELERLRERCEAYKGQVEAGAGEIARLRAIATRLLAAMDNMHERGETFTGRVSIAAAAMRQAIQ